MARPPIAIALPLLLLLLSPLLLSSAAFVGDSLFRKCCENYADLPKECNLFCRYRLFDKRILLRLWLPDSVCPLRDVQQIYFSCATDGTSLAECCEAAGVPARCLHLCSPDTMESDAVFGGNGQYRLAPCMRYDKQMKQCFVRHVSEKYAEGSTSTTGTTPAPSGESGESDEGGTTLATLRSDELQYEDDAETTSDEGETAEGSSDAKSEQQSEEVSEEKPSEEEEEVEEESDESLEEWQSDSESEEKEKSKKKSKKKSKEKSKDKSKKKKKSKEKSKEEEEKEHDELDFSNWGEGFGDITDDNTQPRRKVTPDERFAKCCKYYVPQSCYKLCTYAKFNKRSLTQAYAEKSCPLMETGIGLLQCAAQERDHEQCCEEAGIQPLCMPFCRAMTDDFSTVGAKHLPCLDKLETMSERCFQQARRKRPQDPRE